MVIIFKTAKPLIFEPQAGMGRPDDTDRLMTDFLAYIEAGKPMGGTYDLFHGLAMNHTVIRFEDVVAMVK